MTREEFLDMYGHIKVVFTHYYKYTFFFEGPDDEGNTLCVSVGGDSGSIYKVSVVADEEETVASLDPYYAFLRNGNLTKEVYLR